MVCLSVCYNHKPCHNCQTDRDAIWVVDSGGPKVPCFGGGPEPPCEGASLREKYSKLLGHCAVNCAKTAELIEMSFLMWTRVGPRKHVLGGCTLAPPGNTI